ncbi:hypothetical protein [Tabrizicola aquatica]|uniref:hypothetical protein n=1 Tax=Tabrizicola aquatica TaxID=909926 RepID=UPI000CCFF19E|nr:hypothetical protein [Tabrizicola aquatica]
MLNRMRLLKGATALLYIGPLFAGMCGFGWGLVAPFSAIFVVWLMILRPEQWPTTPNEWLTGSALLAALAQVLSQVALVAVLFGLGRGIGAVAGVVPVVNPVLPLSISFLAIPLCRMLWDAREAADQGFFLDAEAEAAHRPRAAAEAGAAVTPLLNLPDAAPDTQVTEAVARTLGGVNGDVRLKALTAALANPGRSHAALRRALVLWATEPEVVAPGRIPHAVASSFAIAEGNPDLLRLFVPRAMALLQAFPYRAQGFPTAARLRQAAAAGMNDDPNADLPRHLRDDLCDGLRALARAVDAALAREADAKADLAPLDPVPVPKTRHA